MRRLMGISAAAIGAVGTLICVAAVGISWWVTARVADRVGNVAERLEQGLTDAETRLAHVEERLAAVRASLDETHAAAELIAAENPELPRVRAAVEQLVDRMMPTIDRAAAIADSLLPVAAVLRSAADIATQFGGESGRARIAADAIDHAASLLSTPRERIRAVKSAQAVRLTRELLDVAREAVAGSERLANGIAAAVGSLPVPGGRWPSGASDSCSGATPPRLLTHWCGRGAGSVSCAWSAGGNDGFRSGRS